MKQTTQRFILLALIALLALFAGCKGESPTAPPPITGTNGTGSGTGTTQPPVGSNIALSATTTAPFTGSTSTITATVTVNNAPVPNGTAVEFSTTAANASFTDTTDAPTTLIRTTVNGIAKATVTSSVAGPVIVNVTVNNVTKSITLNFQDPVIPPVPTSTAPTISSITPAQGLPTGNQTVVITGTNFRTPVRVLFDPGNGQPAKEAFPTNVTPTSITVTTPAFDLGVSQQLIVGVTVIVEAGTPTEQRVTKAAAFTYTAPVLTPVVRALSPTSGPIDGGTRVVITGDAFEAPAQVFFGSAQAQILSVTFHTIEVITPSARDTSANGSGAVLGPVAVKVLNVNSGKSVVVADAFRYVNKAQITAITPSEGPFTGGTRVLIDGTGFNDPVAVSLAGIAASVIKVTASEITVISNGIAVTGCADVTGPVVVTNVDNGDTATGPNWIYRVLKPVIISVGAGSPTLGGNTTVTVANAVGAPRIVIGDQTAAITGATDNGNGTTTYTIQVPSTLTLNTQACPAAPGVNAVIPTAFDVTYTSLTTTCTDKLAKGLTVSPAGPIVAVSPPIGFTTFSATAPIPPTVTPPSAGSPFQPAPPQSVSVTNAGSGTLIVSSVNTSGPGCGSFTVQPTSSSQPTAFPSNLSSCDVFPIVAQFTPSVANQVPGFTAQCTIVITTNAGVRNLALSGTVR
jgi:hypothetical protein